MFCPSVECSVVHILRLSVQKHFQHRVTNWRKGEYCSARFSEDKIWYRAQIEELRGDKILVRFVDFGNSEELKAAYVVPLEKDFRELPYQVWWSGLVD